ncbi:hypothetical protein D3C72_962680 [compost metagenome]
MDVIHNQTFKDLVTQGLVIRQLLTGLLRIELHRLQQGVYVALKYHAVIHDGGDFIHFLGCCERGIGTNHQSENKRSPVLHTFPIL